MFMIFNGILMIFHLACSKLLTFTNFRLIARTIFVNQLIKVPITIFGMTQVWNPKIRGIKIYYREVIESEDTLPGPLK